MEVHLAIPASLQALHLNAKKQIIEINLHDKNPNRREANQLAIYKDDWGVEPGTYPEPHQLVARAGFEPRSPHWLCHPASLKATL